jgi:choline dehydrogenase-like flavoprotein
MGSSARSSVVDDENRVWGMQNLFVADASTFPSASGVNPMLTVMAIAHRAAGVIAAH